MLRRLSIKDVALIENLEIEFGDGFNVFTGETGAGKSIVIDAMNLALGERANRELIKHGSDKAIVEALFTLEEDSPARKILAELGIDVEEDLIISRELSSTGKNVCRVDGNLLTLSMLKRITDPMVDIHGQHAHQSLLQPENHIHFLDLYAGEDCAQKKAHVASLSSEFRRIRNEQLSGFLSDAERAREIDILQYQIREIDGAALHEGEEEELFAERRILSNAARIMEALEESFTLVNGEEGALQALRCAQRSMAGISDFSKEYADISIGMENAFYSLEDISISLRELKNSFIFDPQRLDEVEKRLDAISDLKRKYGADISAILCFRESAEKKLDNILDAQRRSLELERALRETSAAYEKAAAALTEARHAAASLLEERLCEELHKLGMENARFGLLFTPIPAENCPEEGVDTVSFLFSANSGEPLKALDKIASGGELSRIMLALKTLYADKDSIATMIFDEIDTGISGKTAMAVGNRMMRIANQRQVICVTHLPQIAAYADTHFLVEKMDDGRQTHTVVRALSEAEKVQRLAAMMSGETVTPLARELSTQLIENCEAEKHNIRKDS